MCFWDEEDVKLIHKDDVERRFFVRVDETKTSPEAVEKVFGQTQILRVEGLTDEFGFVTPVMAEKTVEEKADILGGIITRIRMEE